MGRSWIRLNISIVISFTMETETCNDLEDILNNVQSLSLNKETNKVVCSLSGHEMPPKIDAVQSYLTGKRYAKLKKQKDFDDDFAKYKEHIIPSEHKRCKHQFFCKLTLRHMNPDPDHIKKHINGKRFQKAFKRWEECQRSGEIFKPRNHARNATTLDENEDKSGPEDDMSDLYPDMTAGDISDNNNKDQDKMKSMDNDEDDFIDLSDEEEAKSVSNGFKKGKKKKIKNLDGESKTISNAEVASITNKLKKANKRKLNADKENGSQLVKKRIKKASQAEEGPNTNQKKNKKKKKSKELL